MKLIIDISEHDKNVIERFVRGDGFEDMPPSIIENLIRAIYFATPLEKHDAEVIKETVASVWGKPPYTEVLDSIKAEVADAQLIGYAIVNGKREIASKAVLEIINKYKRGKE